VIGNGDALIVIPVDPVKMRFMVLPPFLRKYPSIGLVLNVEEFSAVKPVTGAVFGGFAANRPGHNFAHHPPGIPDGLNRRAVACGLRLLCAIPNGVDLWDIGFQAPVYQYSPFTCYPTAF